MTRDVPGTYLRLTERVLALVTATGRVPALVGWSIGGVVSRETAREHPEAVRRVITFGTPVTGGPASSVVGRRYSAEFLAEVRARVDERNRIPIDVPITAMWSRRDGIVAPEACIDQLSANVEHIEVSSTHLGMGLDPDVWAVIARRLMA
jgi:pimeloyl-ACP methyl ester carboxylesterase